MFLESLVSHTIAMMFIMKRNVNMTRIEFIFCVSFELLHFTIPHFKRSQNKDLVAQLGKQKATVFAMDCIPRTLSRGQAR